MGAPGAGKGTMSKLIKDKYQIVHISTGDMLRQAVSEQTPVGLKAKEYMGKGTLVPDEVIHDIIVERLSKDDIKKGFLFDGYPRTVEQAIDLDKILQELNLKLDYIINLNIDDEKLKDRISGRRSCKNCGAVYHIKNLKPKVEGICDVCGSELYQRADDTIEALGKRLESYYKQTTPVIDYYDKTGLIHNMDSNNEADVVFEEIVKVLGD